jgi:hypothetical protein
MKCAGCGIAFCGTTEIYINIRSILKASEKTVKAMPTQSTKVQISSALSNDDLWANRSMSTKSGFESNK